MGGAKWPDLCKRNDGVLTGMGDPNKPSGSAGWRGMNRQGGHGAMLFDGSTSAVSVLTDSSLLPPLLSVAAWVRMTNTGVAQRVIVSRALITDLAGFLLSPSAANQMRLVIGNGSALTTITESGTITVGGWRRYVGTYDGVNSRLYLNGSLVAGPTACTLTYLAAAPVTIGADGDGSSPFGGSIDDVTIVNRAWSPAEVILDYQLSQQGYPGVLRRISSVVCSFPFVVATSRLLLARRRRMVG